MTALVNRTALYSLLNTSPCAPGYIEVSFNHIVFRVLLLV